MPKIIDRSPIAPTPALDNLVKSTLGLELQGKKDVIAPSRTLITRATLPPTLEKLLPDLQVFESRNIEALRTKGVATFRLNTEVATAFMMLQGPNRLVVLAKNLTEAVLAETGPETKILDAKDQRAISFAIAGKENEKQDGFIVSPDLNAYNFRTDTFDPKTALRYIAAINDLKDIAGHAEGAKVPLITADHLVGAQVLADPTLEIHGIYKNSKNPGHMVDERRNQLGADISASVPLEDGKVGEGLIWDPAKATNRFGYGRLPYYVVLFADLVHITPNEQIILKHRDEIIHAVAEQTGEVIQPVADIQRMGYASMVKHGQAQNFQDDMYKRAEQGDLMI